MGKTIRITPTIQDGAVVSNGIIFDITEVTNVTDRLGGTQLLKSISAILDAASFPKMDILFFRKSSDVLDLGILGQLPDAGADAAITGREFIGGVTLNGIAAGGSGDLNGTFVQSTLNVDLMVASEENTQSIYMAGINRSGASFTFDDADDLELVLGFE